MQVLTTEELGETQSMTPEGYLLCAAVPISRTGTLLYAAHEHPEIEAVGGIIYAHRDEADVFDPAAIASFAGKPVIISHDGGEITPDNWREHSIGTVLNPRRGEGNRSNCLLADLLITDSEGISFIRNQKNPQVSAGYQAEYQQISPGQARQRSILGNHVALVKAGRCGPICAIGDQAMAKRVRIRPRTKIVDEAAIRRAFISRDAEELEQALGGPGAGEPMGDPDDTEMPGAGMEEEPDNGEQHHITVNIHGAGGSAPTAAIDQPPTPAGSSDDAPPSPDGGAPAPQMPEWAVALMARLDAIEAALAQLGGGADDQEDDDYQEEGDDDEGDDGGKEEEVTKDASRTWENKEVTTDSKSLVAEHRETIVRAQLLVPGIALPTFDAKAPAKVTRDSLCLFRRRVLARASRDAKVSAIISPLVGGRDLGSMSCSHAATIFAASAELVKNQNVRRTADGLVRTIPAANPNAPKQLTPAEINRINREKFGYGA